MRKIGARAEGPAGPSNDHRPHGIVGVGAVEGRDELFHHYAVERVELVGPVEGNREHATVERAVESFEVHAVSPIRGSDATQLTVSPRSSRRQAVS